jgi:hypothetical protein
VNWISFGGSDVSPVNLADLLTTAAVVALGVIQLTRLARDRMPARRRRAAVAGVATLIVGISIAGAAHARNGVLARRAVPQAAVTSRSHATVAAATRRLDLGTPPASASTNSWQDDIRQIELDGSTVTVVWASERVSVATRSVLGWRVDGVSALYRHAVIVGPTTLDLYLPPPQSGESLCLWQPIGPSVRGAPPAWECNAGTPPLRLRPRPVLFS